MKTGDYVVVEKGSRNLGIDKGTGARVEKIEDFEHGASITLRLPGSFRRLFLRYRKHLNNPEISLSNGNGIDKIVVRTLPEGQIAPGFVRVNKD